MFRMVPGNDLNYIFKLIDFHHLSKNPFQIIYLQYITFHANSWHIYNRIPVCNI